MYWGNRNWQPFLDDTVREMADAGVERAIAFVTSAYSSYSACRQYYDDIDRAIAAVGPRAPKIDKIRPYFNHPGFIEPWAAGVADALAALDPGARAGVRLVCTAHSVPVGMAAASGSHTAGTWVDGRAGGAARSEEGAAAIPRSSGKSHNLSPNGPWATLPGSTSPIRVAAARRACPGSSRISTSSWRGRPRTARPGWWWRRSGSSATTWRSCTTWTWRRRETAASLGLPFARAKAPGSTPRFARMVCELVAERTEGAPALALGDLGLGAFAGGALNCPADCCRYAPQRPGRPA